MWKIDPAVFNCQKFLTYHTATLGFLCECESLKAAVGCFLYFSQLYSLWKAVRVVNLQRQPSSFSEWPHTKKPLHEGVGRKHGNQYQVCGQMYLSHLVSNILLMNEQHFKTDVVIVRNIFEQEWRHSVKRSPILCLIFAVSRKLDCNQTHGYELNLKK